MVKVVVHYKEPADTDLHTSVKFDLPAKWQNEPTDKIKNYIIQNYNKKFKGKLSLDAGDMHMATKQGFRLAGDALNKDALAGQDIEGRVDLSLKHGAAPTAASQKKSAYAIEEVGGAAAPPAAPGVTPSTAKLLQPVPGGAASRKLRIMDVDHGAGTTTPAVTIGNKKRFHTTFRDGCEMVEEMEGGEVMLRKWREKTVLGTQGNWIFEIGEEGAPVDAVAVEGLFSSSSANPSWHAKDTVGAWEWRVRNIAYPVDTYSVTVDAETSELVLRTTNKKYFKRFSIPAMRRAQLALESAAVSFEHSGQTLLIQYEKPDSIAEAEARAVQEKLAPVRR